MLYINGWNNPPNCTDFKVPTPWIEDVLMLVHLTIIQMQLKMMAHAVMLVDVLTQLLQIMTR